MADIFEGIFLIEPAPPVRPPLELALQLLAVQAEADRRRDDHTLSVVISHITDLEVWNARLEHENRQLRQLPAVAAWGRLRQQLADAVAAKAAYQGEARRLAALLTPGMQHG